ncbi:MAG: Bcr/CflA family efflux MFS transporter [Desulfovibrio sp.]|nr:Bcr/CflA family efflux MFS transporter [Desulfovibrio sp.]
MANSNRFFWPGNRFLVLFLSFLSAFAPLSTDMYLPALPAMAENFGVSSDSVADTITLFFLVFAISMLFWGPISDRYGRRPALLAGSLLYTVSSVFIALANSLDWMLFWRCVQALGSGAASSLALAIVKDALKGRLMQNVIGFMQTITVLAPLTAPVIGGGTLLFVSWRGIFWILALCGFVSFLGTLGLRETVRSRSQAGFLNIASRIGVVLKNAKFRDALIIFSAMAMPFMSYLALSPFVYQDVFGLSAQVYSLFFALNSCFIMVGPASYLKYFHRFDRVRLIFIQLVVMALSGTIALLAGRSGPWIFLFAFAPVSFCGSLMRPPSTLIMLESNRGDNGVIASLINCGALLCGSLSMFVSTLPFWPNPVFTIGAMTAIVSFSCAVFWYIIGKNYSG